METFSISISRPPQPLNLVPGHAHHLDPVLLQDLDALCPGGGVAGSNPSCALLHHVCCETFGSGVGRRTAHAEIQGQAHHVDMRHAFLPQEGGEPGVTDAGTLEGVVEGAVHLDTRVLSFFHDAIDAVQVQLGDQVGAWGVLDAVHRPQAGVVGFCGVVGVGDGDGVLKGLLVVVVGREGDVVGGVPVLRGDADGEGQRQQLVDGARNPATPCHGEGAVGRAEVLLEVDDDECWGEGVGGHICKREMHSV